MSFIKELPLNIAIQAHNGTSWTPEKRGEQEQQRWQAMMESILERFNQRATHDDDRARVPQVFEDFQTRYMAKYTDCLHKRGRIVSANIAGPSKFPVRQMEKRNMSYDKAVAELGEWERKAINRALETIRPSPPRFIASDAPDAVQQLQTKIDRAKANQERMKAVNKVIRGKGTVEEKATRLQEMGLSTHPAYKLQEGDFMGRKGFPAYETQNNLANIKRMEARIADITREQTRPEAEPAEINGVTIEENRDLNRIQLFFPGKPDDATRANLKRHGFRWSPREGAWQRQLTDNARYAAKQVLKEQ